MLTLNEKRLISRGKTRYCYQHPLHDHLVVKIPAGPGKDQQQANLKEYKGYQSLMSRHATLDCISHCHGFVETDRGRGLICDCVRDFDGAIAATIWEMVIDRDECDLEQIIAIAEDFCTHLIENDIRLFDLNLKNIALAKQSDNGYRPVAIDLKGKYDNKEFIPVSSYIRYFARRKMKRRTHQLIERIRFARAHRGELQPS